MRFTIYEMTLLLGTLAKTTHKASPEIIYITKAEFTESTLTAKLKNAIKFLPTKPVILFIESENYKLNAAIFLQQTLANEDINIHLLNHDNPSPSQILTENNLKNILEQKLLLNNYHLFIEDYISSAIHNTDEVDGSWLRLLDKLLRLSFENENNGILNIPFVQSKLLDIYQNKFSIKPYPTIFKELGKSSAYIGLAMMALTAGVFVNISTFSQHSEDTMLTAVIILTLQRVIWAWGTTPLGSVQINISKALSQDPSAVGRIIQTGYLMSFLLGGTSALFSAFAVGPLLKTIGMSDVISNTAQQTFEAYAVGFIGYCIMGATAKALIPLGKTQIFMLSNFFASLVGIAAVEVLTNGYIGFPKLGPAGYGWGLTIQCWVSAFPGTIYLFAKYRQQLGLLRQHPGILHELWRSLKQGMPLFFQRNADVFAAFGLAIMAGHIGTNALIAENIVETYRMLFGRVGANSISQALMSMTSEVYANILMAQTNKWNVDHRVVKPYIENLTRLRNTGTAISVAYGGFWLLLYSVIPNSLSSPFVTSKDDLTPELTEIIKWTLLISGIGQLFDDIRQIQLADMNGRKIFGNFTAIALTLNLGIMLALAYAFGLPADLGAKGLELANAICFLIAVGIFQYLIHSYTNKLEAAFTTNEVDLLSTDELVLGSPAEPTRDSSSSRLNWCPQIFSSSISRDKELHEPLLADHSAETPIETAPENSSRSSSGWFNSIASFFNRTHTARTEIAAITNTAQLRT